MKHHLVKDKFDNIIINNLTDNCKNCYNNCNSIGFLIQSCPEYGDTRRQGLLNNNKSSSFLCCNETKTTKLFRQKLEALSYAYTDLIIAKSEIEEKIRINEEKKNTRLVHNLSAINARSIQEIYNFIQQDKFTSDSKYTLNYIKNEILNNAAAAANMFLRLAKNNLHMKSEFSIYRRLDRSEQTSINLSKHNIRKVLLNILHTFFADFNSIGIYVNVAESNEEVLIDYETIQVALIHIIDNATKYAKHHSTINITFESINDKIIVKFDMISAYVNPVERELIFNEGISGIMAKKMKKNGDGIGLWQIKRVMELNKGSFHIQFGEIIESINNYHFAQNIFILEFNRFSR